MTAGDPPLAGRPTPAAAAPPRRGERALDEPRRLLTFEFVGLCLVALLAVANSTAFYNLFGHLETLGVAPELRGIVVGAYSLTAMVLYLVASPFLTVRLASPAMLTGIGILVLGGLAYLVTHSFWGLLLLRAFCGAGHFLMGAGAMALLVTVIPPERSGQAFGLYSVAILVAYGVVPAAMDVVTPWLGSAARGYAAATASLLPAAGIVLGLRRRARRGARADGPRRQPPTSWRDAWTSVARPPVALLLLVNAAYFMNWSSLYYLYKGFAERSRLGNVGSFLTVLTVVMILIRLLTGRLFDRFDKAWLMVLSFAIIAAGHQALFHAPPGAIPLVGALFGLGLGSGYPALNGLMFEVSEPRFRPLNANLMSFAIQAGSFLGPAAGGALLAEHGYRGYFLGASGLALASAAASAVFARARRTGRGAGALRGGGAA